VDLCSDHSNKRVEQIRPKKRDKILTLDDESGGLSEVLSARAGTLVNTKRGFLNHNKYSAAVEGTLSLSCVPGSGVAGYAPS
jgi:hypothetical protein